MHIHTHTHTHTCTYTHTHTHTAHTLFFFYVLLLFSILQVGYKHNIISNTIQTSLTHTCHTHPPPHTHAHTTHHTHTHLSIHTHTCTYTHTHNAHTHTCTYTHTHTRHTHTHTHTHIHKHFWPCLSQRSRCTKVPFLCFLLFFYPHKLKCAHTHTHIHTNKCMQLVSFWYAKEDNFKHSSVLLAMGDKNLYAIWRKKSILFNHVTVKTHIRFSEWNLIPI